jgi:two-component system, LytTR family, sensor kinase
MPFITFALLSIMYGDRLFHEWRVVVYGACLIYFVGVISWLLHYQYDLHLQTRYPGVQYTRPRIIMKLLINVLVMSPSVISILLLFHWLRVEGYQLHRAHLVPALLVGASTNLIFETLYELVYIIDNYKATAIEREQLEKMNLDQEFDHLKQRVNPHFLFNCFNTLSSLISENKVQAEKFLDELSKVYRYLLKTNEDGLSTVENEVKFIHSYYELIKTRHGDGVVLNLQIDRKYFAYLVPSLSLQLLLENAVKHNVVSKSSPLFIEIFTTEGNQLVVNNNLNRKIQKETSTRIGLQNIAAKYQLMQQEGFLVVDGEKNFMVVLPMIYNPVKFNEQKLQR